MGVEKQVLRAGTGRKVVRGQNVTVHCTGFESSLMDFYKMLPGIDFTLTAEDQLNIFLLGSGTFGKNRDLSQKFWSTKDPGQTPFTFKIGQGSVIKGWDEGVLDMQIGEVARLQCSPDYAYGTSGFPAWGIQPNSVLVFEIEVLSSQ